jgi:hypothetical protein
LADGIVLERAGIPAVSICTDAFRITAEAMAQSLGFPGYEYVAIPHPIASRTEKELTEMVRAALPAILRILGVEGAGVEGTGVEGGTA